MKKSRLCARPIVQLFLASFLATSVITVMVRWKNPEAPRKLNVQHGDEKISYANAIEDNLRMKLSEVMTLDEHKLLQDRISKLIHALSESEMRNDDFELKIPALGGNPERIIISAGWRTGSTFLSELVFSSLRNMSFFTYEPLLDKFQVSLVSKNSRYF